MVVTFTKTLFQRNSPISNNINICKNIFVNTEQNKLYQKHFKNA